MLSDLLEFIENRTCQVSFGDSLSKFVDTVSLFKDCRVLAVISRAQIRVEHIPIDRFQITLSTIDNGISHKNLFNVIWITKLLGEYDMMET